MNEQEIAAMKQRVAELEADVQAKTEALTKAESDKNSTVEELTKLRTAKQEVEAKLTIAESKLNPDNSSQGNVEEEVNKVLAKKEETRLADLRVATERKFKESHSEFHPDNDTGGLKFAAFKQKLARINLAGLTTEEEILAAYGDAMALLSIGESSNRSEFNPYAATNKDASGKINGVNSNKLTQNELKLIAQLNWTEERYLKVKKAQPHYVETMLAQFK